MAVRGVGGEISTTYTCNYSGSQIDNIIATAGDTCGPAISAATVAKTAAVSAKTAAEMAQAGAEAAQGTSAASASAAAASASAAAASLATVTDSATAAAASAATAAAKETDAATSAANALTAKNNVSASATAASASLTAAATSATNATIAAALAATAAAEAAAWATGKRDGVDVDSSDDTYHNNVDYYRLQTQARAQNISANKIQLTVVTPATIYVPAYHSYTIDGTFGTATDADRQVDIAGTGDTLVVTIDRITTYTV